RLSVLKSRVGILRRRGKTPRPRVALLGTGPSSSIRRRLSLSLTRKRATCTTSTATERSDVAYVQAPLHKEEAAFATHATYGSGVVSLLHDTEQRWSCQDTCWGIGCTK
ncbi:hypothetical protein GBAR_LOCUS7703, partial [Geodia barretti]